MPPLISLARSCDIPDILTFVMGARAGMFPMLDPDVMPDDLQRFEDVYLAPEAGRFLIARHAGQLVGVIGYLPYDGRFPQLDYSGHKTVEVVRLFIAPDFRRMGLAARLFDALKAVAVEQGVEVLYLHTHPFLPGAISFWQRQGFAIDDIEDDPIWHTTHMHRSIGA
jgi:GNAT superfamily N-acetyltransferase